MKNKMKILIIMLFCSVFTFTLINANSEENKSYAVPDGEITIIFKNVYGTVYSTTDVKVDALEVCAMFFDPETSSMLLTKTSDDTVLLEYQITEDISEFSSLVITGASSLGVGVESGLVSFEGEDYTNRPISFSDLVDCEFIINSTTGLVGGDYNIILSTEKALIDVPIQTYVVNQNFDEDTFDINDYISSSVSLEKYQEYLYDEVVNFVDLNEVATAKDVDVSKLTLEGVYITYGSFDVVNRHNQSASNGIYPDGTEALVFLILHEEESPVVKPTLEWKFAESSGEVYASYEVDPAEPQLFHYIPTLTPPTGYHYTFQINGTGTVYENINDIANNEITTDTTIVITKVASVHVFTWVFLALNSNTGEIESSGDAIEFNYGEKPLMWLLEQDGFSSLDEMKQAMLAQNFIVRFYRDEEMIDEITNGEENTLLMPDSDLTIYMYLEEVCVSVPFYVYFFVNGVICDHTERFEKNIQIRIGKELWKDDVMLYIDLEEVSEVKGYEVSQLEKIAVYFDYQSLETDTNRVQSLTFDSETSIFIRINVTITETWTCTFVKLTEQVSGDFISTEENFSFMLNSKPLLTIINNMGSSSMEELKTRLENDSDRIVSFYLDDELTQEITNGEENTFLMPDSNLVIYMKEEIKRINLPIYVYLLDDDFSGNDYTLLNSSVYAGVELLYNQLLELIDLEDIATDNSLLLSQLEIEGLYVSFDDLALSINQIYSFESCEADELYVGITVKPVYDLTISVLLKENEVHVIEAGTFVSGTEFSRQEIRDRFIKPLVLISTIFVAELGYQASDIEYDNWYLGNQMPEVLALSRNETIIAKFNYIGNYTLSFQTNIDGVEIPSIIKKAGETIDLNGVDIPRYIFMGYYSTVEMAPGDEVHELTHVFNADETIYVKLFPFRSDLTIIKNREAVLTISEIKQLYDNALFDGVTAEVKTDQYSGKGNVIGNYNITFEVKYLDHVKEDTITIQVLGGLTLDYVVNDTIVIPNVINYSKELLVSDLSTIKKLPAEQVNAIITSDYYLTEKAEVGIYDTNITYVSTSGLEGNINMKLKVINSTQYDIVEVEEPSAMDTVIEIIVIVSLIGIAIFVFKRLLK